MISPVSFRSSRETANHGFANTQAHKHAFEELCILQQVLLTVWTGVLNSDSDNSVDRHLVIKTWLTEICLYVLGASKQSSSNVISEIKGINTFY